MCLYVSLTKFIGHLIYERGLCSVYYRRFSATLSSWMLIARVAGNACKNASVQLQHFGEQNQSSNTLKNL